MSEFLLNIGDIVQFKGTRYNKFLNGMSGECRIEQFSKRSHRMYSTRVIRFTVLKCNYEATNWAVNVEEMEVEFAPLGSDDFKTFHYSLIGLEKQPGIINYV